MPGAYVKLLGWDALVGPQLLQSGIQQSQQHQQGDDAANDALFQPLQNIVEQLRRDAIVKRLLTDKDTIITSLERLSWLAVLLAAATFTAAIAPPGGYDNGLLFLPYSNADCQSEQSSGSSGGGEQPYSSVSSCSISASKAACPVGAEDISGTCIQAPDACTNGIDCKAQLYAGNLRAFFVLDLLSFGFSMALVLFVVACSMPRKIGTQSAKYAGLIWLSLVVASLLMAAAVGCGMGALVAGLLAVYPKELLVDVWAPFAVTAAMTGCAFWMLVVRWMAMWPGSAAFWGGVLHVRKQALKPLAPLGSLLKPFFQRICCCCKQPAQPAAVSRLNAI